jgi:hypothetical protein
MAGSDRQIEHLLRRAGFGARPDELALYGAMSTTQAANALVDYESIPDAVDSKIGSAGYVGTTVTGGAFSPQSNINHARQRWLFRMVHSDRPLQEKMTLFWHNHFATGYNKIAGALGAAEGARYLAAKATEDPGQVHGQIEMLRDNALGKFKDILLAIAKDTAMLVWLDGRTNTKAKPQENFGREIMELFTVGVGNYTEPDVYAAARVFTGWNLQRPGVAADGTQHYAFVYNSGQHETTAKTFSFAIYPDGGRTIPARSAADGMQDGIDFINGLAAHPNTARYLATKLYRFFVNEFGAVNVTFVNRVAQVYLQSGGDMKSVMREVLLLAGILLPMTLAPRWLKNMREVVAISTGQVDTKFGFDVASGAALAAISRASAPRSTSAASCAAPGSRHRSCRSSSSRPRRPPRW